MGEMMWSVSTLGGRLVFIGPKFTNTVRQGALKIYQQWVSQISGCSSQWVFKSVDVPNQWVSQISGCPKHGRIYVRTHFPPHSTNCTPALLEEKTSRSTAL